MYVENTGQNMYIYIYVYIYLFIGGGKVCFI